MATGGLGLHLLQAKQVAVDQVGADVASKQLQILGFGEQAVGGQVFAVVENDVGVLHSGVVQVGGRGVQPGQTGVHKQNRWLWANVHQIQGVGHDCDTRPFLETAHGRAHVCAVVQHVNMGCGLNSPQGAGADALFLAVIVQGTGQNAAVTTMGDKGLEDPVLNHALDGADRQAKHFGGLAGAEILGRGLCHVHRLVLWMVGGAGGALGMSNE